MLIEKTDVWFVCNNDLSDEVPRENGDFARVTFVLYRAGLLFVILLSFASAFVTSVSVMAGRSLTA